ncbi:ArsA family ATPase [Natrialbaceae archaeon AArc-T1-2]|uniref:ArsA family ATPase n=1 Tax=Natrialbaceae archaeon AArc-T1-2 TaxID=3053904 RepID=UPI00255ABD41|nr:TRC40/GET3/ArsA family transport-energizing ATPase [Natrialbaceae archaeon AArc-T1-2]WIV68401.1 TRC40/GET3/ArsA family transport-energizing ATPase [Natrialbaceae archaeon AArc-T1-2]
MTECIFYGGKGGVGKTTCAAATGLALADAGRETLVVSTDPAHSLSDAFEIDLGSDPSRIRPGLQAVEIDTDSRADRYERIATALASDLRSAGIRLADEDVERIFAAGTPAGGDELAALDLLVEYVDADAWEVVVFDTAPTGHTLRLFDLPDVMGRTLETTRSLRGQVRRIGDTARRMTLGPLSYVSGRDDDADDLEHLQARMERARALMVDPDRTEFRIVTVPERMAIAESERLLERLREASVSVRTIVVNRVLEDPGEDCSRCRSRTKRHERRVAEIRETVPDLEVVTLPETEREVHGLETLSVISDRLPVSLSSEP